jgi:hypothetical protein
MRLLRSPSHTAQHVQPSAPQNSFRSDAGMLSDDARACAWPCTLHALMQPLTGTPIIDDRCSARGNTASLSGCPPTLATPAGSSTSAWTRDWTCSTRLTSTPTATRKRFSGVRLRGAATRSSSPPKPACEVARAGTMWEARAASARSRRRHAAPPGHRLHRLVSAACLR